ncbi:hypothetical protein EK904_014899 [Melospiza melodia maxima]|nr:hypothetical protein EK904_014899 [Melospiza melodia maxima]
MKRKLAAAGTLRLSPNEEAMFLKEEYERRRKLRLQQVREQQKYISYQIRQKVKQRREEQLHQLEEALRAEWQKAQDEKMKALEELRADARKRALEVERQRAAKVASLPPPPPHPFESFEVKKILAMKPCGAGNFSVTRYHIAEALVDREVGGEQPDAHLAAEEEGRRLEELRREAEKERRKQLEKAHIRGSHALKKIQLAKDRERFLEELEQMHAQDRMRRRQVVAQMPPQLSVPPCKRMETKEEWQRELESAFEEMCSEDRRHEEGKTCQPRSKLALKKLLNKIRSQKDEWTSKNEKESQSEFETIESGTVAGERRPLCDLELNKEQQKNTVCEAKDSMKMLETTVADEKSVPIHPQEQAAKIRMEEAAKMRMEEEKQKWVRTLGMLEKPQKQQEQVHDICPGKSVQFSEASDLKHGGFHLPCDCASQEQVGIFETANNCIREPFQSHLPSGSVRKEVTAVRTQPEAHQQHFRFVLPAESSSESSETVHSKELPQKISNYQNKTEAREEHLFKTSVMPATKRSALADPLAYQQGSVESSSKTCPDQPLSLSEPTILVHEESKAQGVEEFLMSKAGDASSLNYAGILSLRDRVLASSESIQAQQKHLKELQEQLDAQREALLSKQRIQEKLLLQKQDKLKEQMQRQQEALKQLLNKQVRHICPNEEMTEAQKPVRIKTTDFFQVSENYQQENCGRSKFHGSETISRCIGPVEQTEQPEKVHCREQKRRSSKPPVTKVKLGLGLEQHELSIIPEVDTPKNCSLSLAGITSYEGKASNESPRQTNPPGRLLQQLLMMAAETSCESAQSQDSQVSQDSPVVAAEGGERLRTSSGPSLGLDNTEVPGSEAFMQRIPCDGTSAVSTGTFSTSEMLNASPVDTGLSSDRREGGIVREAGSHPWNSSLPFTLQQRQEILSGVSESQLSEGKMCFYKENQIEHILGRPTGNLNSHSEDNTHFQALETELCFPEMEGPFPNFHHQTFQPLEPSVDFDTSSSSSCSQYRISQHSREFTKNSEFPTESPDVSAFLEENSGLNRQRSSLPSALEANGQNISSEEGSVRENVTLGSEESFHPLQLESTLSDDCQNSDQPGDVNIVSQRPFEQAPGIKNRGNENCVSPASEYEELSRSMRCINLQCSVEDVQNKSLIHLEEQKSFYQLDPIPVPMDETSPQQLVEETVSSEKLPLEAFDKKKDVKLPEKSVHVDEVNKAVELHSQCNMDVKEPDQSFPEGQESLRVLRETNLEDSDIHLQSVVQQNSSLFQGHEKRSHPVPRSSCHIPVWETESGHGIMEEPELTLVSSNDISIVESDIGHPNQEKIKEDAMDNSACVDQSECNVFTEEREFLPLTPDADDSAFVRPDSSPKAQSPNKSHCPSHQTAVMLLEFAAAPRSLQKSFLKRKQNFIQASLKRVEAIKNKERENEKMQASKLLGGKSENLRSRQEESGRLSGKNGALANQLKKVGEVKVSSPEDRKSGEIEMHQRTSRLYNQLAEVKIRNEEKTRQETYAKNREKAKEFQKGSHFSFSTVVSWLVVFAENAGETAGQEDLESTMTGKDFEQQGHMVVLVQSRPLSAAALVEYSALHTEYPKPLWSPVQSSPQVQMD